MAQEFTRNIKKLKKEQINDSIIKEFTDVNDLVSDDKDNYIKRPNETMHCLTDNLKKIETSNSLLSVSNQNDLNKSILTVNHDETKENVLTSEKGTVSITRGEKTNIEVNTDGIFEKNIFTYKVVNEADLIGYMRVNKLEKFIELYTTGKKLFTNDKNLYELKLFPDYDSQECSNYLTNLQFSCVFAFEGGAVVISAEGAKLTINIQNVSEFNLYLSSDESGWKMFANGLFKRPEVG